MELTPMMRQIESVPALMTELLPALRQKAAALAADAQLRDARKLVLVGCGDSYCAALAARPAFAELTGLDAEWPYAIDIARSYSRRALTRHPGTVYVFISNSGAVSRMVEAGPSGLPAWAARCWRSPAVSVPPSTGCPPWR